MLLSATRFRGFAPHHVELMAKDKVFGFQRGPRSEQPDQGAPDLSAKIAHRSDYQPIRERQSAVWVCGRDHRHAGSFPASSGRSGPHATDRSISSIAALLLIALPKVGDQVTVPGMVRIW